MEPPREDGRRCLTGDEMLELGWRPFTDDELAESRRDRHRAGFGVELWHDPAERERARRNLARPGARRLAHAQGALRAARTSEPLSEPEQLEIADSVTSRSPAA
jgi:hypothetical protein